jgi:hypothetical protein
MYADCIFCQSTLGSNDHIPHFPIGRRLAFDSAKGRLWVVCTQCAQWNLAPLDERWEAVEDCEREFRGVRARVSTAEIGLARLPDGLDLIRIGPGLLVGGTIAAATGVRSGSPFSFTHPIRIFADDGSVIELGRQLTFDIEMRAHDGPGGIQLAMGTMIDDGTDLLPHQSPGYVTISGGEAVRAARLLLPRINRGGASAASVQSAVGVIEGTGASEDFLPRALALVRKAGQTYSPIRAYPTAIRLAIEMALHEEAERRAMEGELAELEAAWREAERVAGISDDLLLPPHVTAFLDRHRTR